MYIVDRIEEKYIVLEKNGIIMNVQKEKFDFKVKEGDVVIKDINGKFVLDENNTISLKKQIEDIVQDLWEN